MQGEDLQKNGRLLISRAGQLCYVRNKLLSKDGEVLASKGVSVNLPSPRRQEKRKLSSTPVPIVPPVSESQDNAEFRFMSSPTENMREELKKNRDLPRKVQSSMSPRRNVLEHKETKVRNT